MTLLTGITPLAATNAAPIAGRDFSDLGQEDFFRLLTVQIQQQDPFDPVDNNQMLAQMAQFTSLSGINDVNDTLQLISDKLDVLGAAQAAAQAQSLNSPTET